MVTGEGGTVGPQLTLPVTGLWSEMLFSHLIEGPHVPIVLRAVSLPLLMEDVPALESE